MFNLHVEMLSLLSPEALPRKSISECRSPKDGQVTVSTLVSQQTICQHTKVAFPKYLLEEWTPEVKVFPTPTALPK